MLRLHFSMRHVGTHVDLHRILHLNFDKSPNSKNSNPDDTRDYLELIHLYITSNVPVCGLSFPVHYIVSCSFLFRSFVCSGFDTSLRLLRRLGHSAGFLSSSRNIRSRSVYRSSRQSSLLYQDSRFFSVLYSKLALPTTVTHLARQLFYPPSVIDNTLSQLPSIIKQNACLYTLRCVRIRRPVFGRRRPGCPEPFPAAASKTKRYPQQCW